MPENYRRGKGGGKAELNWGEGVKDQGYGGQRGVIGVKCKLGGKWEYGALEKVGVGVTLKMFGRSR